MWWGYIETCESSLGAVRFRASIGSVYNRVKITYRLSHGELAGQQFETAWASSADSLAKYGQREVIRNVNQATATGAENYRATYLDSHKRPRRAPSEIGEVSGGRLTCRGWWDTLGWRHMDSDTLAVGSYTTISGDAVQGALSSGTRVMQSFTVATTKVARILQFYMRRTTPVDFGTHGGQFRARLLSGAGAGGLTILGTSAVVHNSEVSEDFHWHSFTLTGNVTCSPATTYWADMGQGGQWEVRVDEGLGDSGGSMLIHNQGSQGTRPNKTGKPDADMPFQVYTLADSTAIIADIATAVGEFIAGSDVEGTSGLLLSEAREQDANALDDIEELITMGTTNSRRVLAEVKADRRLRIREEPAASETGDYKLITGEDGGPVILDALGNVVERARCPAGMWLRVMGPLTKGVLETDEEAAFVEGCEYDARSGNLRFRMRGEPDMFDFTAVKAIGMPRE